MHHVLTLLALALLPACIGTPPSAAPSAGDDTRVRASDASADASGATDTALRDVTTTELPVWLDTETGTGGRDATTQDGARADLDDAADDGRDGDTASRVIVLVADDDDGVSQPIADRLTQEHGFLVEIVPETAAPQTDVALIVVADTVDGGGSFDSNLKVAWDPVNVPMLVLKPQAADELGVALTFEDRRMVVDETELDVIAPAHPIAAGFSGSLAVFATARGNFCYTSVVGDAVATSATLEACGASVWAVPVNTPLRDGTTRSTRRAAICLGDEGAHADWTPDAWALFDAAVEWLLQS